MFGVLLLFRILYVGAGRLSVYDDEAPALDSYLQRSEPAYAGAGQGAAGGLLAPGVSTLVHEDASVTFLLFFNALQREEANLSTF